MSGFQLSREKKLVTFIPLDALPSEETEDNDGDQNNYELTVRWFEALKMHFIQRDIYKNYKMLEIIGQGSFGRVIKALPLN